MIRPASKNIMPTSKQCRTKMRGNIFIVVLLVVFMLVVMVGSFYYPFPSGEPMTMGGFFQLWFREASLLVLLIIGLIAAGVSWLRRTLKSRHNGKQNALKHFVRVVRFAHWDRPPAALSCGPSTTTLGLMGITILTIAITTGLSGGVFLGYWSSKLLAIKLSKSSIAPRLVMVCSIAGAVLLMLPTLLFSFFMGGNIGGGFGAFITESIGLGSGGAPVGLAAGIAVILGVGLGIGALIGGMLGRLLTHVLPKSVLTHHSSGTR